MIGTGASVGRGISIYVDTSVWSLAFRRKRPASGREVDLLRGLIDAGEPIRLFGIVLQEVLEGFREPEQHQKLRARLSPFEVILATREDHEMGAELHGICRRKGMSQGTVDCLIAASTIRREGALLTADQDFHRMAQIVNLELL